ncbi:MAG: Na+/H+ antiporter subunit E [Candidatus Margulisiibacteriota bacterium]|nr:Na+/H+ antiporter subunit E [Candidatus Margulisiibacteriota bacterium]
MRIEELRTINKILITFFFLFVLWLLFTFSFDPFSLLLGGIFSLIISMATYDLFIEKGEEIQKGILPRFEYFLIYFFVVLWEIYLGSFNVVYRVLTRKINPGVVKIRTRLKSKFARVLLANSITLTPGTVTIDLQEDCLYVHWLAVKTDNAHQAARVIKGNYEAQLKRIFY